MRLSKVVYILGFVFNNLWTINAAPAENDIPEQKQQDIVPDKNVASVNSFSDSTVHENVLETGATSDDKKKDLNSDIYPMPYPVEPPLAGSGKTIDNQENTYSGNLKINDANDYSSQNKEQDMHFGMGASTFAASSAGEVKATENTGFSKTETSKKTGKKKFKEKKDGDQLKTVIVKLDEEQIEKMIKKIKDCNKNDSKQKEIILDLPIYTNLDVNNFELQQKYNGQNWLVNDLSQIEVWRVIRNLLSLGANPHSVIIIVNNKSDLYSGLQYVLHIKKNAGQHFDIILRN